METELKDHKRTINKSFNKYTEKLIQLSCSAYIGISDLLDYGILVPVRG